MKLLPFFVVALCGASFAHADETIRSLQQTLKNQGLYYGTITGDKSVETVSAIRRYQIRNGLQVTGELNEETMRSVSSSAKSVATESRPTLKPAGGQPDNVRADMSARLTRSSSLPPVVQSDRSPQISPLYSASFYQSAPVRMSRQMIAEIQYQLMRRGYYRGRLDGSYGRQTAFAVRAFQARTSLSASGRLDMATLEALGSPNTGIVSSAPVPRGHETWMPVRKFKNGRWKVKWKRTDRPFDRQDTDEAEQANRDPSWNPYNRD